MLKADLHVHTCHSKDSTSSPDLIVRHCLEVGINCLAVTDHNSIDGALEVTRIAPFEVIVGEEMMTTGGEIIGLFLSELIPPRLCPEETVARIKAQGGLVCIPHPFDRFRPHSRLSRDSLEKIMPDIDLIEVFNSRTYLLRDSKRAMKYAQSHGLPGIVGSDAHVIREIGRSYIEMPEFNDVEQFRLALSKGRMVMRKTGVFIHFYNVRNRIVKRLKRTE
ncbi:MAG: PHP domain-containing protein [Dehalococcoidia bacterium]|nr:MAG: PHP domain-containing protein [Dehalococcoidia bacterium]UCG83945.1 MAG: PHP domain-containing protein [Dehalococcoidia bacterium]